MVGHVDSDFKAGMIDYMMDASECVQSLSIGPIPPSAFLDHA
jgi:hypothetical protein